MFMLINQGLNRNSWRCLKLLFSLDEIVLDALSFLSCQELVDLLGMEVVLQKPVFAHDANDFESFLHGDI